MKTSNDDFKYFCKRVKEEQKALSLCDWKLYVKHEDLAGSYAWVHPDSEAKQATIGLSIDWTGTKVTKDMLAYCARHEVLHLLLADLVACGKYRQSSDTDFTTAQHAIIRRLESVLE